MHWNQRTRATAKESDWEGRGEAAAYRRLSLRTKSLTSGCTSGMAACAKANPKEMRRGSDFGWGSAARSKLGGVRVFRGGRGRELTPTAPRLYEFYNSAHVLNL